MAAMREWQKELLGLGVGAWVVHVLLAAALIATMVAALRDLAH